MYDGIVDLLADLRAFGSATGGGHSPSRSRRREDSRPLRHRAAFRGDRRCQRRRQLRWRRCAGPRPAQLAPHPERVVMVGDRAHDVEGAAAHGIDTVVVEATAQPISPDPTRVPRRQGSARCASCANCWGWPVAEALKIRPLHVTFVCSGNICRPRWPRRCSPTRISERGLTGLVRVSAGTGGLACRRRRRRPRRPGAASTLPHRALGQQVGDDHLSADMVVALANHFRILTDWGVDPDRLRMMRSFDPRSGAHVPDVEDPYYGDLRTSRTCSPSFVRPAGPARLGGCAARRTRNG